MTKQNVLGSLRIAILTHEYAPHNIGGIGAFCKALAEALGRRGIDVLVIAGRPEKGSERIRAETERNVEVLWVSRGPLPPKHFWFQVKNNSLIRNEIANCDAVHGQDCAAFPTLQLCKKSGLRIPWIITFHTNPIAELREAIPLNYGRGFSLADFVTYAAEFPLWDLTVRKHAKDATELVCVSNSLRRELRDMYRIRRSIEVIHTCVDTAKVRESLGRAEGRSPSRTRLSYAGRWYNRKGPMELLRVARYLKEELDFTNFDLEFFGKGPLEKQMRSYVSRHGLDQNIQLRGYPPREVLWDKLASTDIFCFPSSYEACPVGLIEAMALGKPVVAFDFPFAREILGESTDSLASNTLDFARKIVRLSNDSDKRLTLGRILYERASNFDSARIAANYQAAYDNIIR